jgi:hypothetical protein
MPPLIASKNNLEQDLLISRCHENDQALSLYTPNGYIFLPNFTFLILKHSIITVMEKVNKICQSCGMPLKRDIAGGGTNADGSKSLLYCSHCYQTGQFTRPDVTVQQMKDRVVEKLVEMKFPRFIAKLFTYNIPKLERWKTKQGN